MEPLPGESALVVGSLDVGTYTIGKLGSYAVAHLQADMGSEGPNAAPLATSDAIRELKPKLVLLVGIAFGINRAKQRLGDVLAAQHVTSYEMVKLKPETIEERGETLHGNIILCERIKAHKRSWELLRADGSQVDVHVGQLISGAKLVNNREFRDALARRFPAALGGEMEGIGAYAATFRRNVPVLLVKAICDWADGLKNDRAQPFAAAAAVSLVRHVLSKPDALKALEIPTTEGGHQSSTRLVEQHLASLKQRWADHRPLGALSSMTAWTSDLKSADVFVLPRIQNVGDNIELELRADTILARVRSGASVALFGQVGTGKSTLLLWCAAALASYHLSESALTPIPILAHARELHERKWSDLIDRLFPHARESLHASSWFLLVDGIDEVDVGVWSSLSRLRREFPTIVGLLAASRPATSPAQEDGFESVALGSWSQPDVERFLSSWRRSDRDAVERVRTQLGGSAGVDLLRNPLTATAALLIANEARTLPQSRAGIVACIAQLLFQTWRRARGDAAIKWEDVQPALVELATISVRGEALTIDHVRKAFAARGYAAALSLSDEVERELGVLVRTDRRHFEFVLRAIAEHLVGDATRTQPWMVFERSARAPWGREVVRHALGISTDLGMNDVANQRLIELSGSASTALLDVSALRAVLSMIDATADLAFANAELARNTIDRVADAIVRLLLEETSVWIGDAVAESVRRLAEAGGEVWQAVLSRLAGRVGASQSDPVLWYAQAKQSIEDWIGTLLHRDPAVRTVAVDHLGQHLERPDVQNALLLAISDEGHDFGNAPPSVRAGLLWRTIPRGPHTIEPIRHLNRLVASPGQYVAGAAAVALRPGEAPARDIARALFWLSQACDVPRSIVEELRSSEDGARAIDEAWPGWKAKVTDTVRREQYGILDHAVIAPPPSVIVRNRVAHACGPRLGEMEESVFSVIRARVSMRVASELISTGHIERALERAPDDVPLDAQHALGAVLLRSPQARTRVLGLWPSPNGGLYPGIALEPLIEAGDTEATRVYAEWLPQSPYNWGHLLRSPLATVLRDPVVLPVAHRLAKDVINRVHVRDAKGYRLAVSRAAVVLRNFAPVWFDDPTMLERVWSIGDADEAEGLRALLIATEDVELDRALIEDLFRRVHASLEATCPKTGGPIDGMRALRAEREVEWIENRGFVQQSLPMLRCLGQLRHPISWCALAVLWPTLTEQERLAASRRVAEDAIDEPFASLPDIYLKRFVRVAPEVWCSELEFAIEDGRALEGAIGTRALSLLPRELQVRIARTLQASRLVALELPWRNIGDVGRCARRADIARHLLFEIGDDSSK
jgi:nucleoside phosphorylase